MIAISFSLRPLFLNQLLSTFPRRPSLFWPLVLANQSSLTSHASELKYNHKYIIHILEFMKSMHQYVSLSDSVWCV